MLKVKLYWKAIPIILIISILFTACDVPDLTAFTSASAEMTRGIRVGVKETGTILKDVAKSNFVSKQAQDEIKTSSDKFAKAVKPTLNALDSLDAYLEALNALALSNKKSQENAEAAVTSVSNLVTAVSALQIPDTVLKVGTVIVTLANQIKTSKDFKKRVTLTELLVNGGSADTNTQCSRQNYELTNIKLRDSLENLFPDLKSQRQSLESAGGQNIKNSIQTLYDNKIISLTEKERETWLREAGSNFCGIVDILKMNMEDLSAIQASSLTKLYLDAIAKNKIITSYHDGIISNDRKVQNKISLILSYRNQRERLKEFIQWGESVENINDIRLSINETLDDIYIADDTLEPAILDTVRKTENACQADVNCLKSDDAKETRRQGIITLALEKREKDWMLENARLIIELNRINPAYTAVINELDRLKKKQNEMDSLFESSIEALDTWGQTHANLRVSLNTKKPLTVSRLISKTKEIWEILKPETTNK